MSNQLVRLHVNVVLIQVLLSSSCSCVYCLHEFDAIVHIVVLAILCSSCFCCLDDAPITASQVLDNLLRMSSALPSTTSLAEPSSSASNDYPARDSDS